MIFPWYSHDIPRPHGSILQIISRPSQRWIAWSPAVATSRPGAARPWREPRCIEWNGRWRGDRIFLVGIYPLVIWKTIGKWWFNGVLLGFTIWSLVTWLLNMAREIVDLPRWWFSIAMLNCQRVLAKFGGFRKCRYPKMDGNLISWTISLKWMILGYPHFRKPPYLAFMLILLWFDFWLRDT